MYFVAVFVEAIIASMLNGKTERTEHVNATFLVLIRNTFLLALLSRIVSLSPDGLVTVHLSQFRLDFSGFNISERLTLLKPL